MILELRGKIIYRLNRASPSRQEIEILIQREFMLTVHFIPYFRVPASEDLSVLHKGEGDSPIFGACGIGLS